MAVSSLAFGTVGGFWPFFGVSVGAKLFHQICDGEFCFAARANAFSILELHFGLTVRARHEDRAAEMITNETLYFAERRSGWANDA